MKKMIVKKSGKRITRRGVKLQAEDEGGDNDYIIVTNTNLLYIFFNHSGIRFLRT